MSKTVDGVIKDWGERVFYPTLKGKKGKNVRSGGKTKEPVKASGPATREKIALTVKKAPEVMVKVSGGGKNMQHIKAHMDYISRNGDVDIEDENGDVHLGKHAVRDIADSWEKGRIGIPREGERRKEAFNIILSMPPGTDRQAVKDAARDFAKAQFGNHQYIFASHDDEKHPHVHLAVKAVGHDGVRLNPRKGDLQHWREVFAEKLIAHGIEANATPRKARGVVRKAEIQAIKHIDRGYVAGKRKAPSRVTAAQRADAEKEASTGQPRINPAQDKIIAARRKVQKGYGDVARALSAGDLEDKKLALDIVQFIKDVPPPVTRHQEMVTAVREQTAKDQGKHKPKDKPQDVSKEL